jgi:hypothetical protein
MYLVHDRSGAHPSQQIPGLTWKVVMHPPHSPDMMPLDYGIFGAAKGDLDRKVQPTWKWVDRVNEFKRILQGCH